MCTRIWWVRPVSSSFCQAEDCIRDLTVTGVQTCALPISRLIVVEEDELPLRWPLQDFVAARIHAGYLEPTLVGDKEHHRFPGHGPGVNHGYGDGALQEIGRASCRERV